MKIVVDIDEKDYRDFQLQAVMLNPAEPSQRAKLAIANGTLLPERKTGKWKSNLIDTCSECHALCPTINGERTHTPYCPRCGAKMEVDE